MEIAGRKAARVPGKARHRKMGQPNGLLTTPSRKISARRSKGEPEITAVTGCNGGFWVRDAEDDAQAESMLAGQPK